MNGLTGSMNRSNSGQSTPPEKLLDMPDGLFYPFFPEAHVAAIASVPTPKTGDSASSSGQDYSRILKAAAAAQGGYGGAYAPEDRGGMQADAQQQQGAVGWAGLVRGS
jgi:hypothetical protein